MPEILTWQRVKPSEAMARALEHLESGRLVAFPTEGVYEVGAGGLREEGLARLESILGEPWTLLLHEPGEVADWWPNLAGAGKRLARRAWPGPVNFSRPQGWDPGLSARLPEIVRQRMVQQGSLGLRASAHPVPRHLARCLEGPLVSAPLDNALTAEQAAHILGDRVGLIIDAGPSLLGKPSTVVGLEGRKWRLLHEGVVQAREIEDLARCHILFVCTGNTCRSPLAEVLCRKLLAERLQVAPQDLTGFRIQSAGLAARVGSEASAEAIRVAEELGCDLSRHQSQPVTVELLADADFLFTMTWSHLRVLAPLEEAGGPRPRLLSYRYEEIIDPVGSGPDQYRDCARQILTYLEELLPELLESY